VFGSRAILVVAVIVLALGTWLLLRSDNRPTNTAEVPMHGPELEQRATAELVPAPVEALREAVAEAAPTSAEVVVAAAADASAPVAPQIVTISAGEMLTVRGNLERNS